MNRLMMKKLPTTMSTKWQIESSTMDKMKIRHGAAQISHIVEKLVMNR